ncbi:MAG: PASTA domain-containing protein [Chitinivibrionales bacterium]
MKKNYTISVPASIFWKVVVPAIVLGIIAGGIIGVFIVDKMVMPRIVNMDRGMVTVPSIVNVPWEEARQDLFNVGLRLQISVRQYDEKIPRDNVVSQQPLPQENVKKGRLVVVVVSKGSEIGVIPTVTNLTERKATTELKKMGFIVGKSKRDYFDDYPKDVVASVSPKEGTSISREMPVDIVVSDGPKPTHADVPNLIGEGLLIAKSKIEKSGLKLGKIEYKANSTVLPGTVISQSAPPESSVPLESAINIVVSVAN